VENVEYCNGRAVIVVLMSGCLQVSMRAAEKSLGVVVQKLWEAEYRVSELIGSAASPRIFSLSDLAKTRARQKCLR
jgi:hypothetical protein